MATIVPVDPSGAGQTVKNRFRKIREETGHTTWLDWIWTPDWASHATLRYNLSASGGTTPIFTPAVWEADPFGVAGVLVDTNKQLVAGLALTGGPQSTGIVNIAIGPGITGIANATAAMATSGVSYVSLNDNLPALLGVGLTMDHTTGDETYTYTVTIEYHR